MTNDAKIFQLIVRQGSASSSQLEPLLQHLNKQFGLDAYTARVRLTGSGKSMFGSGPLEKTSELAAVLRQHGYDCWVIQRSEAKLAPIRLRDLEISADEVKLIGRDQEVLLTRKSRVVAVLADISGKLEERALKRHAVQSRYKKASHVTSMADEKMVDSVLKGSPVLDLYLLDAQNQPQAAVRVFPARFNAKGLGDRMTMSATRNLQAIVQLARDYAEHVSLHADFSLGRLPNCQVKNLDGQFLDEDMVLKSLTRFGWLMCDLEQDQGPAEKPAEEVDPTLAAVAIAAGRPELAAAMATGNLDAMPGLNEVVKEIKAATAETEEKQEKEDDVEDEWLPMPPDRPARQFQGRMVLSSVGVAVLAATLALVGQGDTWLLRSVVKYGVKAGIVPGLVAAGMLWAGFFFIKLKRKIENTPTSRIRSMAMGLVEIHGKTVRKYALVSPINQSSCVYYRLRKYKKDRNNRWTLTSDKDSRHVPFMVDDGTGQVLVDPSGATVRAKTSRTGMPGEATLAFHGVSTDDSNEKWVEDIIFEGTSLYVLGYAQPLKEERKSLRERTVEKLRDLKLDRKALQGYDADGDGQISEQEWQSARSDAEQLALKEHLATGASGKRQEEHAVIAKSPQRGLPFVVAETAEEAHLVRKYWLLSMPLIVFGLLAAALSLYFFLQFLGI